LGGALPVRTAVPFSGPFHRGGGCGGGTDQLFHRVQPCPDLVQVQGGLADPAAQQARPHGRHATIQYAQQAALHAAIAQRVGQLQVAACDAVQVHVGRQAVRGQVAQVGQAALGFGRLRLVRLQVGQDRGGGPGGLGQADATIRFQRGHIQVASQPLFRGVGAQVGFGQWGEPRRMYPLQLSNESFVLQQRRGQHQLARRQPVQLLQQGRQLWCLGGGELARGELDIRQTVAAIAPRYGRQIVLRLFPQQSFLDDGAGRDDAHHVSLDQPLCLARVLELFHHCHLVTALDQAADVGRDAAIWHAAHG
jgi:hypothetical protein